ncbi:IS701 family transposase [Nocardia sp. NPDC051321]|uniref:IS701 family transposase n=1 Tax=Nocardia sp. NPDC051321 TaxID=3364323 RepID=UPI0037A4AE40
MFEDFEETADLCNVLFASLPRKDQRSRAALYLKGLLNSPGRKSVRNIARSLDGSVTDQSLHHFISASNWDWMPIRRAFAEYLFARQPIESWVVHSMAIKKSGQHSVGVERRFLPTAGRVMNVQQATAIWALSPEITAPVDWRLHLPRGWLDDQHRRSSAAIPSDLLPQLREDLIVELCLQLKNNWHLPVRPVVLDARDLDIRAVVPRLHAHGIPSLSRIDHSTELHVADEMLTGHRGDCLIPAGGIMKAAKGNCRRILLQPGGELPGKMRSPRVAPVTVGFVPRSRSSVGGQVAELALLEIPAQTGSSTRTLWLTDLPTDRVGDLVRLGMALSRVERDSAEVADKAGVRDYSGRSYGGWHRHVTLASVAHALMMRLAADRDKLAPMEAAG